MAKLAEATERIAIGRRGLLMPGRESRARDSEVLPHRRPTNVRKHAPRSAADEAVLEVHGVTVASDAIIDVYFPESEAPGPVDAQSEDDFHPLLAAG